MAAGGEDGLHEGFRIAQFLEGCVVIREQGAEETGEIIARFSFGRLPGLGFLLLLHAAKCVHIKGLTLAGGLTGPGNIKAGVDIGHEPFCAGELDLLLGEDIAECHAVVIHAEPEVGAGEAVHFLTVLVLEDGFETLGHAGCQLLMLTGATRGKGAFHALVGLYHTFYIFPDLLAFLCEQAQGIQMEEALLGGTGKGGILLITGAVAAVMGDVEGFESLGCRGVLNGIELIIVHVVGGTVRILRKEPQGLFLGAEPKAHGCKKQGGKNAFDHSSSDVFLQIY